MTAFRSPLKHNKLLRQANALRRELPGYLQHSCDWDDPALERGELLDAYGEPFGDVQTEEG